MCEMYEIRCVCAQYDPPLVKNRTSLPVVQKNVIKCGQSLLKVFSMTSKKLSVSLQMLISFNPWGQMFQNFHHTLLYTFSTRSNGYILKNKNKMGCMVLGLFISYYYYYYYHNLYYDF